MSFFLNPFILGVLAVNSLLLTGCIDKSDASNQSIKSKVLGVSYTCSKDGNLNSWPLSLHIKVRRERDTKGAEFDLAGTRLANYKIDSVVTTYQTEGGQEPNFPENVDVLFEQDGIVFRVKENKGYPACQISFENGSYIATQVCEFEDKTLNYRAKNFELPCRRVGKMRVYNNDL